MNRKPRAQSLCVKTLNDLESIINNHEISKATTEQLMSQDSESRARAAIELLTRPDPKLIETIVDHVRNWKLIELENGYFFIWVKINLVS